MHFSISDKMSMMYKSACAAAEELGSVYVVDSKSLSTGIGLLVLSATDMLKEGKTAEEIFNRSVERVKHVQASFATKLKIKPSLLVVDGEITVYNKYFSKTGRRALNKYMEDILEQFDNPDTTRIFITHTEMSAETVDMVRDYIKEKTKFKTIIETVAGSTITSHCGPGTLGILYINDGEKI